MVQVLRDHNIGWANAPVPTLFLRPCIYVGIFWKSAFIMSQVTVARFSIDEILKTQTPTLNLSTDILLHIRATSTDSKQVAAE